MSKSYDVFSNKFAQDIYLQKYSMDGQEKWEDTCKRVVDNVCGQLLDSDDKDTILKLMVQRKFIPGGRYLYSAGRPFHQVNNCFKGDESFLTDRGCFTFEELKDEVVNVRNWKGEWEKAQVKHFGIQKIVKITLSNGDVINTTAGHLWIQPDGSRVTTDSLERVMLSKIDNFPEMDKEGIRHDLDVVHKEYTDNFEEVYCVVAPETHTFTLSNGVLTSNCFLFRADDSREGWSEALYKATMALMTGGGIGFDYSKVRASGSKINKTGGVATGPLSLMHMVNESGRHIMQGGQRRSAIWASLIWNHKDINSFMKCKDWNKDLRRLKDEDFNFQLPMELTNISVNYDTEFFIAVDDKKHPQHKEAMRVWTENCKQAFSTAEPGMAMNFLKDNESLRNACSEITSEDDSDKCNLGTMWINRFDTKEEFGEAIKYANLFLLCGSIYSDVPTDKIREVGERNNRIGLGLGGIHEWLMIRGYDYEVTPELHKWLNVYEQESESSAFIGAKKLGVSVPKGKRAIAPTGTIGIIAETTTGIEPLFCKAYKRRYLKDGTWHYQYVVDGAVKRLLEKGVKLENIKDAYDLTFKQRVKFQADVQNYVDMAISSTCNLPSWGSELNNEESLKKNSKMLLKYAKRLRGFTCYPDGARGGQPLTRVSLEEALANEGQVFEEKEHECVGGVCGL